MDDPKKDWLLSAFSHAQKRRYFLPHAAVVLLEILAVFVLLMAVAFGGFVWKLRAGPIDVSFARDYIETALADPQAGLTPSVETIVLDWSDITGPLLLSFKNAKLFNAQGEAVVSVDEASLSLSKAALLIGKISPVALIIKQPVLQVTRGTDGAIGLGLLGVEAKPKPGQEKTPSPFFANLLEYINHPATSGRQGLGALKAFKIENAKVVIEDKTLSASWVAPSLNAKFESQRDGFKGSVDFELSDDPAAPSYFKMDMVTPWDTKISQVKAEAKNIDPWFFAQKIPTLTALKKGDALFDAQAAMVLDATMKPLKAALEISSPNGKVTDSNVATHEVTYANAGLSAEYDSEKGKLEVTKLGAVIEGLTVQGKASFDVKDGEISGPAHIGVVEIEQKNLADIWPPPLAEDAARDWAVNKISGGVFTDIAGDAVLSLHKSDAGVWEFSAKDATASLKFNGMNVDYRAPLAPVKNGKGDIKIIADKERMVVNVESGTLGDLTIKSGQVEIGNIFTHDKGVADINVKLQGPLKGVLTYLTADPINLKHTFDLDKVAGQADLDVNIGLPTLHDIRMKDVQVVVLGAASDIIMPGIVKSLDLTGGPYKVALKEGALDVSGPGALGGADGTFEYKTFLDSEGKAYKDQVNAKINTTPVMRQGLGVDLSDFIDGVAPGEVIYTAYQDGHAEADIKSDLTQTHAFFDALGYDKPVGKTGAASAKVKMQNGDIKQVVDLEITADDLGIHKGDIVFRQVKGKSEIAKGTFDDFSVGLTKGSMHMDVDQAGRYKIDVASSNFDLGPVMAQRPKKTSTGPAMTIDMNAAQMRGVDGSTLGAGKFHIERDAQCRYDDFEVNASLGKSDVTSLNYKMDENGVRHFDFNADDAGAMLRAFGIYKNVIGGKIAIHGQSKKEGDPHDMVGQAEMTDFKVVHAPTLARLVSALSLPGIVGLLNNEGLGFSKLQANYSWNYKPEGSVLSIEDGRTSGNSVGFTFDGKIDQSNSTIDVSGTAAPLSTLNRIIGKIPLVGNLLTGGPSAGVIAATYTIRGKTDAPDVSVNPLSVLAPGIVRKILFQ